jgi:hypothetical protein
MTLAATNAVRRIRGLERKVMIAPDSHDLIRRAKLLYDQRLRVELERTHRDYFVAIEPDSGDYFLGRTLSEASAAARQVYPRRRTSVLRVGHPAGIELGECQA